MASAAKKPRTKKAPVAETAPENQIVSIKGFDKDWKCRGYQFAVGQSYEHGGKIRACENGFHACTTEAHPLEVFGYYPPAGSHFAIVTQGGDTHTDDSIKIASAKITIDFELTIGDLVKRAWDYVWSRCTLEAGSQATGTRGAASATGDLGAASATGYLGAASATGDLGAASATGYRGAASATGTRGAASATGDLGAASATGDRGAASATGDLGAASATGDLGAASATGYRGAASATGTRGAAISSYEGKVMGKAGNALFGIERDSNLDIVSVAAGIVGQDDIQADVWYVCQGGKLVAA